MNNVKKNNKGFSLVELIVVVLIMAIIAVSLAPQVMKWVDQSRQAVDVQTKDSIVSALSIASTDKDVYGAAVEITVSNAGIGTYTVTKTGADAAAIANIKSKIEAVYDVTKAKCKSSATISVSMDATGKVTSSMTGLTGDVAAEVSPTP